MKRILAVFLAVSMVCALAACGSSSEAESTEQEITRAAQETEAETAAEETEEAAETVSAASDGVYSFTANGVELVPGTPFDADALPEANFVYTVPSCAIDGEDNVYSYDTYEITAYDEGNGEIIYSIYFTDPNQTTDEGLALGDDLSLVEELYGMDYEQAGTQITYTRGETELIIILQDDVVISIEYLVEL